MKKMLNWHIHAYIMWQRQEDLYYIVRSSEKRQDLQANNRGGKVHNHHEFSDNILLRDIQNEQTSNLKVVACQIE